MNVLLPNVEYYCPKTTVGSNSCLRGMQTQKADWDPTRKETMGSHKKTDCWIRILVSIGSGEVKVESQFSIFIIMDNSLEINVQEHVQCILK